MTNPLDKILFSRPEPVSPEPVSTEPLFVNTKPKPPRRTPRPRAASILEIGDVLAAGLNNGRCPIGRVKTVDDHGFRLNLYSVTAGTFTAGAAVILWSQVSELQLAVQGGGESHEMGPLIDFHTAWTKDTMP